MSNRIKINPRLPESETIKTAAEVLRSGGIIVYPTDTSYGLGADPYNQAAIAKIRRIKERDSDKPILIIINELKDLEGIIQNISAVASRLIEKFWPGPLTLIFETTPGFRKTPIGESGKIGIRLPDSILARSLVKEFGKPVTATSANISGQQSPYSAADMVLGDEVDLVLDGGTSSRAADSTIIDVSGEVPRLLRMGAVGLDELLEIVPEISR